jgi:cyanophycinase
VAWTCRGDVAIELQNMVGADVVRGKTRSVPRQAGVYNVMFEYKDEIVGLAAGRFALEFVNSLLPTHLRGLEGSIRSQLRHSTHSIFRPHTIAFEICRSSMPSARPLADPVGRGGTRTSGTDRRGGGRHSADGRRQVRRGIDERDQATMEEKLIDLREVNAVFFSGGDQLRITSLIGDTPIYQLVHEIFDKGGVIAGTSAGASAMSETMLVRGTNASSFWIGDLSMATGLGLLPNVIIDQHFAERGRIGRRIGAVSQNPRVLGIGIDEDTAIVVRGTRFEVIGAGAVYLVDAGDVTHSNIAEAAADQALSIYDLKLNVLSSGDRFGLGTRRPERRQE